VAMLERALPSSTKINTVSIEHKVRCHSRPRRFRFLAHVLSLTSKPLRRADSVFLFNRLLCELGIVRLVSGERDILRQPGLL
jgi:hypothetical protein